MGDLTSLQVQVWDFPPGQEEAALAIVLQYAGTEFETDAHAAGALDPGYTYMVAEVSVGVIFDLADGLEAEAPGVSFIAWQDPFCGEEGDVLGNVVMYTPGLGRFGADSDAQGNAQINRGRMLNVLAKAEREGVPVKVALDRALGGPWVEARRQAILKRTT
jgi:Protein of unknown function (DUF3145)